MVVNKLSQSEWMQYAEEAHRICFNESGYKALETADFALLVTEDDKLICYTTIKINDAETCYMQWGGAFPDSKGTVSSFKGYLQMIDKLKSEYKYITTRIENTNTPMLKFAMKAGFLICGVRSFKGAVLLEHLLEANNV